MGPCVLWTYDTETFLWCSLWSWTYYIDLVDLSSSMASRTCLDQAEVMMQADLGWGRKSKWF